MNFRELVISETPVISEITALKPEWKSRCPKRWSQWLHVAIYSTYTLNTNRTEGFGRVLITSSRRFIEYYIKVRLTSKYSFNFYILFHSRELAINEISQ